MTLSAVAARYANALADVVTGSASALTPQQAVAELRDPREITIGLLTPVAEIPTFVWNDSPACWLTTRPNRWSLTSGPMPNGRELRDRAR